MNHSFVRIMVGALAVLFFLGGKMEFAPSYLFAIITLTLIAYVGFEIYTFAVSDTSNRWLINPIVLPSIFLFGISSGITNFFYCYSATCEEMMERYHYDYHWLCCAEALALMAVLSMWLGYSSQIGARMAPWLRQLLRFDLFLSRSWELNWFVVWLCLLTSVASRLTMLYLGLFGYNHDVDSDLKYASYNQWLGMSSNLGKLALVVLTIYCAGHKKASALAWQSLYAVLLCELTFGLLSLVKGQLILPTLLVVICYYAVRGKVPLHLLAVISASVFVAYVIVEPARLARHQDTTYDNQSLGGIATVLLESYESSREREGEEMVSHTGFEFFRRMSQLEFSAIGVCYKDTMASSEDQMMFIKDLLIDPLYTFIPRILWPDKPRRGGLGLWFYNEIIGVINPYNSAGPGPVASLYFAGGIGAVLIGFFAVGIAQRLVYQAFWDARSGGSLLVYLGIVCNIADFNGTIEPVFITIILYSPILIAFQYFLFRRS